MTKTKTTGDTPKEAPLRMVKADYGAMYAAAKKSGKLTRPTYRIHTWSEDSATVIGCVIGVGKFVGGKFEAEVNCYRIATSEGMISCILGTYTDTQLEGIPLIDRVVCIQFQGQKSLDDGRKVNVFDVDVLDHTVDDNL